MNNLIAALIAVDNEIQRLHNQLSSQSQHNTHVTSINALSERTETIAQLELLKSIREQLTQAVK